MGGGVGGSMGGWMIGRCKETWKGRIKQTHRWTNQ